MEGSKTNQTKPSNPGKENLKTTSNESIYKGTIIVLVVIIAVLTFMLITSRQSLKEVSTEKTIVDELNAELNEELNSVLAEYNQFKNEYDSVLVQQDSIIQANAEEIKRLINQQSDYRRVRRQLDALRQITQNYVHEMDSLYEENEVLRAENVEMEQEIRKISQESSQLAETKENLEGQVEEAAALRAIEIEANAIRIRGRGREDVTDKARRTNKIEICFTVAANPVADPGNKNVYARIADPDGNIMRVSDSDAYSFTFQEDTLQFSMKGEFNYQRTDTSLCLEWIQNIDYEEGIYFISLYTDQFRLGEASLMLE
ncbi:MAG: hypothetical protein ACOC2E_02245 [Bacteroidota bacterium]